MTGSMNLGSRHAIHMGVNYVLAPPPLVRADRYLAFQQALLAASVEFSEVSRPEVAGGNVIEVRRGTPTPLRVVVKGPVSEPVGQLLIVATPEPQRTLEFFIQETEQVVEAFSQTWPEPARQIVKRDVTLRDLYQTTRDHAFQELWEDRLGQTSESLEVLGGPVLGGGLRLVMPATSQRPAMVEVKLESFLGDTSKVFVEVQYIWSSPSAPGETLDPRGLLEPVDEFIQSSVYDFLGGDDASD